MSVRCSSSKVHRPSQVRRLGGLAVASLLVGVALAPPTSAAPRQAPAGPADGYQAISLGTLGGDTSWSTAMSDRGDVVGRTTVADGTFHGFLWRRGVMTDLGPLNPVDVNDQGQVVGTRDDAAGAWLWRAGHLTRVPGRYGDVGAPVALNNRGHVVGTAQAGDGRSIGVLWSTGRARALPLLDVSDVNDRDEVSGGALSADRSRNQAAVWHRGRLTSLGDAAPGYSGTVGINNRGWVVGWVVDGNRPVDGSLWRGDRRTALGTLEDGGFSQPVAINNPGVVLLMTGADEDTARAALWERGALTDLAGLGSPSDAWFVGLDDQGRIAGTRVVDGVSRATVWQR